MAKSYILYEVGRLLRIERNMRQLTVREAANEVDISASYLSNLENGKVNNPSVEIIASLCNFYFIDFEAILRIMGYEKEEINTIVKRLELNIEITNDINVIKSHYNLMDKEICNMFDLTLKELRAIREGTFSLDFALEIYARTQDKVKSIFKSKNNHAVLPVPPVEALTINFEKTNKNINGTKKIQKEVNYKQLTLINNLDFLLDIDIDFYWNKQLLTEEEKKKIISIIDIVVDNQKKD